MKTFKTLGVLGALALSALAPAAMTGESLYIHVPFAFVAAGHEFPAGDYRVVDNGEGTITVGGSGHSVITLTIPEGAAKPGTTPGLQFTTEGNRHYLVGVQTDAGVRSLPLRSDEHKIALTQ